jgi:beta-lactamase class C
MSSHESRQRAARNEKHAYKRSQSLAAGRGFVTIAPLVVLGLSIMSAIASLGRVLLRRLFPLALLCGGLPAAAQPLNAVLPQFDRDVERIFGAYHIPGAAVAIVQNGRVVYVKTLGVGSTKTRNPVNVHTVFRLASVSKTFAAVLAGQAAYAGEINLSAPLSRYLPGFRLKYDTANRLTVRNVLSHTSGLPHNANDNLLESGVSYPALLTKTQNLGAACPIGRCFGYQNILYSTIGDVLSRQLKHSYPDLLANRIFRPLGMEDASASRWSMLNNRNIAVPHTKGGGGWVAHAITQPYYNVLPAAGVNASITDMSRYLAAVMGHRPDVIPVAVMQELTKPLIRSPKEGATSKWRQTRIKMPMYGMGWRIFQYNGDHKMIFHAGGLSGVRSRLGFLPEKDIGLVMLWNANESHPEVLMPMLFDRLLDLPAVDYLDGAAGASDFYAKTAPASMSSTALAALNTPLLHKTAPQTRAAVVPAKRKATVTRSSRSAVQPSRAVAVKPRAVAPVRQAPPTAPRSRTVDSDDGIVSLTAQRVGYDPLQGKPVVAKPVVSRKAKVTAKKSSKKVTRKQQGTKTKAAPHKTKTTTKKTKRAHRHKARTAA